MRLHDGKNLSDDRRLRYKSKRRQKKLGTVERIYKNTRVSVVTGDLTKLEVDAVVNPANSQLLMGGGVAGAILRVGGSKIQEEALKKGTTPIGKAVTTTGGKLKAKYVIHAPTMTRPAMPTSRENARLAAKAALECARRIGIKSVAFPGMGTGVGGLDTRDAADVMVREIKNHIEAGTTLKEIVLVGFGAQLTQAFQEAVNSLL